MTVVTVRYFAGARAAAGVPEETVPAGCTRDELVAALTTRHGERLGRILRSSGFLVNGLAWHAGDQPVPTDATIDVLPPFAGG